LYGACVSPGQGFWQNQTKNKAVDDKELDPCGNSNAPRLRPLVAQPPSDARIEPRHPPAARMHQQQVKEDSERCEGGGGHRHSQKTGAG